MIPPYDRKDEIMFGSAVTHGATATANLDTRGAAYAEIRVGVSSLAGGTNGTGPTISILHSDDTVVTNFATVVADVTVAAAAEADNYLGTYGIDLRGMKRYLRATCTAPSGSTNSNVTWANAVATLSKLNLGPRNTTDMVADTTQQDARVVG